MPVLLQDIVVASFPCALCRGVRQLRTRHSLPPDGVIVDAVDVIVAPALVVLEEDECQEEDDEHSSDVADVGQDVAKLCLILALRPASA